MGKAVLKYVIRGSGVLLHWDIHPCGRPGGDLGDPTVYNGKFSVGRGGYVGVLLMLVDGINTTAEIQPARPLGTVSKVKLSCCDV